MDEEERALYQKLGFIEGHFVLRGGVHTSLYLPVMDRIFARPKIVHDVLAMQSFGPKFRNQKIGLVLGFESAGVVLAQPIACLLTNYDSYKDGKLHEAYVGYAVLDNRGNVIISRDQRLLLRGRKVLIADDVLTRGTVLSKVIRSVRECGGIPAGVAVYLNRGAITAEDLGVGKLIAHYTLDLRPYTWDNEHACPLCSAGTHRMSHSRRRKMHTRRKKRGP